MIFLHIDQAADIFLAHQGNKKAQGIITIREAEHFVPAQTFERFLAINQIQIYGETQR